MDHGRVSAVIAMIGVEVLRTVLISYLWRAERAAHLRWWSLGVAGQAAGQAAVTMSLLDPRWIQLQPLALILVPAGTMLLLRGTLTLLGRRWSNWWTVATTMSVVAGVAARAAGAPLGVATGLPMLCLSAAYVVMAVGLGWGRSRPPGLGAPITSVAMALTAVHLVDFPFMSGSAWFVPWGTAIALVLEVAITVGLVLVQVDVSRTARAADERHHAELTGALGVGTYETDARGRFTRVNAGMATLLGRDQPADVLTLDPDLDVYADAATRALLDPTRDVEVLPGIDVAWRRRDGKVITVQLFARTQRAGDGTVLGRRGFVVDRTEALRHEEGQRQAQKLEAVGRLAGGIAHDFNNLLTIVRASHGLVARAPLTPAAKDALADAEEAVTQATQLTRRMLAFGRKPGTAPSVVVVEVGEVIRRTAKLLAHTLGERHRLVLDGIDRERWIRLDAGGLEQVLGNLVLNARDAMATGGAIAVTVRDGARDGQPGVVLEVVDTGTGITAADRPHLFEPFFTTKETGRGTGLGLTTVHGLVQQAGGAIDVDSAPGRGTRFTIWFPAAPRSEPTLTPVRGPAALRVLVVDDEPLIRRTVTLMLKDAGLDITEASSGGEVIARYQAGERFDVVLSDVRMPGGDGPTAARAVRAAAPTTRIVLMSGHAGALDVEEPGLIDAFLPKPFTLDQLLSAVRGSTDS